MKQAIVPWKGSAKATADALLTALARIDDRQAVEEFRLFQEFRQLRARYDPESLKRYEDQQPPNPFSHLEKEVKR
jgi:hypothetical protein